MSYGKEVCKKLKEIRQQIADENDIALETSECHYDDECQGTCPKCDAELRYIENELQKKQKRLGKTIAIAGVSLGIAATFAACQLTGDPPTAGLPPEPPTEENINDQPFDQPLAGVAPPPMESSYKAE